jgi:hypothetical protein
MEYRHQKDTYVKMGHTPGGAEKGERWLNPAAMMSTGSKHPSTAPKTIIFPTCSGTVEAMGMHDVSDERFVPLVPRTQHTRKDRHQDANKRENYVPHYTVGHMRCTKLNVAGRSLMAQYYTLNTAQPQGHVTDHAQAVRQKIIGAFVPVRRQEGGRDASQAA